MRGIQGVDGVGMEWGDRLAVTNVMKQSLEDDGEGGVVNVKLLHE